MNFKNILTAAVLAFAFSGNAMALPVLGGSFDIVGSYTTDTGDLATANVFTSFSGESVAAGTGTGVFTGLSAAATSTTMFGFSFDPLAPGMIWKVTTASNVFTFDLTNVQITNQGTLAGGTQVLTLRGGGVLKGYAADGSTKAFEDTNGGWTFGSTNVTGTGPVFSFQSNTVPEPESLAMLGLALLAFGATRKARKA